MNRFRKFLCLLLALVMVTGTVAVNDMVSKQVSAADVLTAVPGSTLIIDTDRDVVEGILAGTTVATVAGNFVGDVSVYNASGVKVSDSDVVGTGYMVRLYSGSTLKDSLALVVHGDVTGDGAVSTADLLSLAAAIKGSSSLAGAYAYAADVNMEGARTASDSISSKKFLAGADIFSSLKGKQYVVVKYIPMYDSLENAKNGVSPTGTLPAGTYYVHKTYPAGLDGMYYLTISASATGAGLWINPKDNVIGGNTDSSEDESSEYESSEEDSSEDESSEEPITGVPYEVVVEINKYSSSADALAQTNPTGKVSVGTYYIYRNYPNGYNGMYNISTDTTGMAAGFWINPSENVEVKGVVYVLEKDTPKYSSSTDAAARINSTGTVPAGTYYIYNKYPDGVNGMLNITTDPTGASVGYWINPNDTGTTAATYVVSKDIPKYTTAADAIAQTNSTGTVTAGTYYIYNNYPNGYNGVYNLTSDSTGAAPGFWINPKDAEEPEPDPTPSPDGTITLVRPVNKYSSSTDAAHQTNITGTADKGTTYYVYKNYPNGVGEAFKDGLKLKQAKRAAGNIRVSGSSPSSSEWFFRY